MATEGTEDTEKKLNIDSNDLITEKVIGAAIEVHRVLGCGLLESIYEEALCQEFRLRQIHFQRQVAMDVMYKGIAIQG